MAAKRGRQSLAEVTTTHKSTNIGQAQRLQAPLHLSDAEIDVWTRVVNDQPAGSFTSVHSDLLEVYCRHVVQARVMAEALLAFDPDWLNDDDGLKRYDKLLAMHERETRALSSHATRLRITRQAIDQTTLARKLGNFTTETKRKPWEIANAEED
jgi:phage terminase small subunit